MSIVNEIVNRVHVGRRKMYSNLDMWERDAANRKYSVDGDGISYYATNRHGAVVGEFDSENSDGWLMVSAAKRSR